MDRVEDPEMSRLILDHLTSLYNINRKREGIHLSTLVYCLTKSFFDHIAPIEATDEEVMLFSLGLGLQDVLTPKAAETPVYEKDGVTFSPDFIVQLGARAEVSPKMPPVHYVELKTTRMSSGKEGFPETWIEYIMGGCYMRGINTYNLSVLYMLGNYRPPFPQIHSFILSFTDEELQNNWNYLMERKHIYSASLIMNKPPIPHMWCKDWECKNCRYKLQCDAIEMLKEEAE